MSARALRAAALLAALLAACEEGGSEGAPASADAAPDADARLLDAARRADADPPGGDAAPDADGEPNPRPDGAPPSADAAPPSADAAPPPPDAAPPPPPDAAPPGPFLTVSGSHNGWDPADPAARLRPDGAAFTGTVVLPVGPIELKFVADGDWETSWGTADEARHLPRAGRLDPAGGNLLVEVPVSGRWQVRVEPGAGDYAFAFAGEPTADQAALLDAIEAGEAPAGLRSPVVSGRDVVIFHDAPVDLAGTFNGWNRNADRLVPAGPRLAYAARRLPPAARAAYKLVSGERWFSDPRALHVEWDGIPRPGPGEFNSLVYTAGWPFTDGRLERVRMASARMGDERDVFVWLPPGYDGAPEADFPVLFVHDGNESITRGHFDQVAGAEIAARTVEPTVLVFVALPSQDVRFDQYTYGVPAGRGDAYADFLTLELLPEIEARYRVRRDRASRGLIGASLGGLISFHTAWRHEAAWRRVGGQSSSFHWLERSMIRTVRDAPRRDYVFYLDSGSPADNSEETREMAGVLRTLGYPVTHVEAAGARHDWPDWEARFGGALRALYGREP